MLKMRLVGAALALALVACAETKSPRVVHAPDLAKAGEAWSPPVFADPLRKEKLRSALPAIEPRATSLSGEERSTCR